MSLTKRRSFPPLFFVLVLLVLSGSAPLLVRAQDHVFLDSARRVFAESRSTEFWLAFPQNARAENSSQLTFRLLITGEKAARGTMSIPGLGITRTFNVQPSQVLILPIDSVAQVFGSDIVQKLGIHIETDNPVAIYGLSSRKASTDTYLAYPVNVLGTVYRAVGYYPLQNEVFTSQTTIVATDNNTNVTITLTANTKGGRRAGETYTVGLQKGDVYQIQSAIGSNYNDLTGTLLTSNKPIAVITGHTCAQVPVDVNFCDQLLEMEPPVPSWGRQFFVGRFESKSEYAIRIIASEPGTQIFINNTLVARLTRAGEFYEDNHMRDNALITTSKPVLVAQYAQSSEADSIRVGDPFLLFITPTEQFLDSYLFLTPVRGDWLHYINLVVENDALNSLRLDGSSIPSRYFKPIGITRYSIAQIEIGYGSHNVSSDKPFGLYSYGFGVAGDNYDSYGNNGGQLVATIPNIEDTLPPTLELVSDDGAGPLALIARDDRLFDLGMKEVLVIDSANFRSPVLIPRFDQGAPQVPLIFRVRDTGMCGFMSLRLTDVRNNTSYFTICRTKIGEMWLYQLFEGRDVICPSCKSWTVQFNTNPAMTISNVTFDKPEYLKAAGTYDHFESRFSGGFSASYILPYSKSFSLSGGIGYSNFSGAAAAFMESFVTDSIYYGDSAGSRKSKLVEKFMIDASFSYLTLNPGVYHYFIPEKLYIYAGLSLGFLLSASYNQTAEILYPATLDYNTSADPARRSTGTRKLTLASGDFPDPTKFLIALELAPGAQFKLDKNFSLLAGLSLNMPLFDALRDVNWHLTSFGLRLGIQYRN